ncbi:hypothetical protein Tco_0881921, partial [Tanacetum coccineum]
MASSIVKCIASNLMMIRVMASSSSFYNTRCFQYDKRDSEDVLESSLFKEKITLESNSVNQTPIEVDNSDMEQEEDEVKVEEEEIGNRYSLKDNNQVKTDKTEHGNEKSMKKSSQSQSQQKKVNQVKVKSQRQSRYGRNVKWANPHPSNGTGQPIKLIS